MRTYTVQLILKNGTTETYPKIKATLSITSIGNHLCPKAFHLIQFVPKKYHKNIFSGHNWWYQKKDKCRPLDPLICDIRSRKGKKIGKLIATPNWKKP